MQIVNFHPHNNQVGARGDCPHCTTRSYFRPVSTYIEPFKQARGQRIASAAECEACNKFVLVVGLRHTSNGQFDLDSVLPLGQPKDEVDNSIPINIASDFKEALRCQWISAHKACVVMCRRAIQASAIELGAKGNKLIDQIDDLRTSGKITEPLREFAHEIRLTGNDGAHPHPHLAPAF